MTNDNESVFGTDDYEKVQSIFENWCWGRGYYYSKWDREWIAELERRDGCEVRSVHLEE